MASHPRWILAVILVGICATVLAVLWSLNQSSWRVASQTPILPLFRAVRNGTQQVLLGTAVSLEWPVDVVLDQPRSTIQWALYNETNAQVTNLLEFQWDENVVTLFLPYAISDPFLYLQYHIRDTESRYIRSESFGLDTALTPPTHPTLWCNQVLNALGTATQSNLYMDWMYQAPPPEVNSRWTLVHTNQSPDLTIECIPQNTTTPDLVITGKATWLSPMIPTLRFTMLYDQQSEAVQTFLQTRTGYDLYEIRIFFQQRFPLYLPTLPVMMSLQIQKDGSWPQTNVVIPLPPTDRTIPRYDLVGGDYPQLSAWFDDQWCVLKVVLPWKQQWPLSHYMWRLAPTHVPSIQWIQADPATGEAWVRCLLPRAAMYDTTFEPRPLQWLVTLQILEEEGEVVVLSQEMMWTYSPAAQQWRIPTTETWQETSLGWYSSTYRLPYPAWSTLVSSGQYQVVAEWYTEWSACPDALQNQRWVMADADDSSVMVPLTPLIPLEAGDLTTDVASGTWHQFLMPVHVDTTVLDRSQLAAQCLSQIRMEQVRGIHLHVDEGHSDLRALVVPDRRQVVARITGLTALDRAWCEAEWRITLYKNRTDRAIVFSTEVATLRYVVWHEASCSWMLTWDYEWLFSNVGLVQQEWDTLCFLFVRSDDWYQDVAVRWKQSFTPDLPPVAAYQKRWRLAALNSTLPSGFTRNWCLSRFPVNTVNECRYLFPNPTPEHDADMYMALMPLAHQVEGRAAYYLRQVTQDGNAGAFLYFGEQSNVFMGEAPATWRAMDPALPMLEVHAPVQTNLLRVVMTMDLDAPVHRVFCSEEDGQMRRGYAFQWWCWDDVEHVYQRRYLHTTHVLPATESGAGWFWDTEPQMCQEHRIWQNEQWNVQVDDKRVPIEYYVLES
jgi:hypothetical protein